MRKISPIISRLIVFLMIFSLLTPINASAAIWSNEITPRNLAMFSSISYADLEKITDYNFLPDKNIDTLKFDTHSMVTDTQLSSIISSTELLGINLSGQTENTYDYLFYGLASTKEVKYWKIVNYAKINSIDSINSSALFTAMTFKKGNDIVIAYRGTDFDDLGDWILDLSYGLIGKTWQEELAQVYAIKVASQYPNSNIYVTGHSLGGYLAQIGGAKLLESSYRDNVKEIGYFNGMGLYFWSNLRNTLFEANLISEKTFNMLSDPKSINNLTQASAKATLEEWSESGGSLVSYRIDGDVISSLGTHCGDTVIFEADEACIEHHHTTDITFTDKRLNNLMLNLSELDNLIRENSIIDFHKLQLKGVDTLSKFVSFISNLALNNNISPYIEKYNPTSIIGYIWITHETDSFFGSPKEPLEVSIKLPSNIKYKEISHATISVNTGKSTLNSTTINTSDLILSNMLKLNVLEVSEAELSKDSYGNNIYTYEVTIEGKWLIGNSRISLKPGVLSVGLYSNLRIASNYIRTTLR